MFIILLNYKKPLEIIDQHLAAHRSFLDEQYRLNHLIASGPKNPRTGGVIISQLNNRMQLEKIFAQDPFKIHDVADYEFMEFTPIKYHPDFLKFISKQAES
jgi:uncharacterized protein YciI